MVEVVHLERDIGRPHQLGEDSLGRGAKVHGTRAKDVVDGTDLLAVGRLPRQAAERMGFEKVEALGSGQRTERATSDVVETVHAGAPSGRDRRSSCAPANLARPLAPTLPSWPQNEYGTSAQVELTLVLHKLASLRSRR